MNKYERIVAKLSKSIITTAEQISESIVSIILALVAIISAIPEFIGLWNVSGEWLLGLAISAMGAAGAHVAVSTGQRKAWAVLLGHVFIAEITIIWYGGGVEFIFPFITIVGALIMSLSSAYAQSAREQAENDSEVKAERKEERRQHQEEARRLKRDIAMLKAEAEAEAIRSGIVPQSVSIQPSGTMPETTQRDAFHTSRDEQQARILDTLRDNGETGVRQLQETLGIPRSTLNRRLSEMRKEGRVTNLNRKWGISHEEGN